MVEVQRRIHLPVARQTRRQLQQKVLMGVIRELYCLLLRPLRVLSSVLAPKALLILSRGLLRLQLRLRMALRTITIIISRHPFLRSLAVSFRTLFFRPHRASSLNGVLAGLGQTVICCLVRLRSRRHQFRTAPDSHEKTKRTRSARVLRVDLGAMRATRG